MLVVRWCGAVWRTGLLLIMECCAAETAALLLSAGGMAVSTGPAVAMVVADELCVVLTFGAFPN